jgi:photosystem II stability/assembly factor-like uncharacterized protein
MKRILMLFAFILLLSNKSNAQDFWEHFYTPDSLGLINDVAVDSSGFIYLACSDYWVGKGGVYRSIDNSSYWQQFRNGLAHAYIHALEVDSEDNLFIGSDDVVYKSTDNAETWEPVLSLYPPDLTIIKCGYDSIILIGNADYNAIYRSGDHGNTWKSVLSFQYAGYNEVINDICFGPNGIIYACSSTLYAGIGNIYQSTDLGLTWQEFPREDYYTCLGFDNNGRLMAGTYGAGIYRYDFATSTWEHILPGGTPNDILVVPDNKVFMSWSYGKVLESDDGGETYNSNSSGILETTDMMHFAVDHAGRIIVHGAWLYRSYDTIFTDININITGKDKLNNLRCYPNPFRNYTDFYFTPEGKQSDMSNLCIYNNSGNLILQRKIKSGEPFRWDAIKLPAGIYIARVVGPGAVCILKLLHF